MSALDKKQQADLTKYESIIEKGQKNFIEVGQALFAIKKNKLYLEAYDTFEQYCQDRWGWGASRARQICGAVKYWQDHKDDPNPPKNERQARSSPNPENGTQTVANQSEERYQGNGSENSEPAPKEPEIQRDKIGRPIPEGILEMWNEAHATGTKLRSMVSEVKCILDKGIGKNKIFGELLNTLVSDAEALHYSLCQLLPYAVCPTCQGKKPERCTTCRHRGFISKIYWDGPCVEKDLRNLIKRQYESATLSA